MQGAYNLHAELASHPIEHFWLASSLVTVIDQIGQGNYSAANTALEALVQQRRAQGLPASVLNISPVDGVGYVAENPHARRSIAFQGMGLTSEAAFLDALELSLLRSDAAITAPIPEDPRAALSATSPPRPWSSPSQVVIGLRSQMDLDDENSRTNWRFSRRMGFYHNKRRNRGGSGEDGSDAAGSDQALRSFIARIAQGGGASLLATDGAETEAFAAQQVARKILDMAIKPADTPVDVHATLAQLGVDSLMAVELRRWFRSAVGLQLSVLEIMQAGTVARLGKLVIGKLAEKHGVSSNRP